ncbi:MAG: alpha/beta fold hydrolase [Pyrinomonadaceae bacterium]
MAKIKRLFKSFSGLVLPIVLLFCLSVVAASVWLVYKSAEPPRSIYLVTPEKYGQLSARGAQVTDEKWTNADGTTARGWLLRGTPNAPAVILLHGYGTDRSYVLNLGVKLNETTDFTILMPDLRGHGENPSVVHTSFGGCETEDALSAIKFLRELKNGENALVSRDIGIFGIELGAFIGLSAAAKDETVKALVLDSVPAQSNAVLDLAVNRRFPFAGFVTSKLAENGTYFYFAGSCYDRDSMCGKANAVSGRKVLLLAGADEPELQESTTKVSRCFPNSTVIESKLDFNLSGYGIMKASLEQADAYDQKVIEFFKRSLSPELPQN